MLITGTPGTGKTTCAEQVAAALPGADKIICTRPASADRQTDRQTGRQTDRQTHTRSRAPHRERERESESESERSRLEPPVLTTSFTRESRLASLVLTSLSLGFLISFAHIFLSFQAHTYPNSVFILLVLATCYFTHVFHAVHLLVA